MIARLATLLLLTSLGACSSVKPAEIFDGAALSEVRSAYVVRHEESKEGIPQAIEAALIKQGISTSHGPLEEKPTEVDAYITYVDRWRWDIGMYLSELDLNIHDNTTRAIIASGRFKNARVFHSFPRAAPKSVEVLDSIFEANR